MLTLNKIRAIAWDKLPPIGTTFEHVYKEHIGSYPVRYVRETLRIIDYGVVMKALPLRGHTMGETDCTKYELAVVAVVKTIHSEHCEATSDSAGNLHFDDKPPQWVMDFMRDGWPPVGFDFERVMS